MQITKKPKRTGHMFFIKKNKKGKKYFFKDLQCMQLIEKINSRSKMN